MCHHAAGQPKNETLSNPRRGFFRFVFGAGTALLSGAAALWAAGTARFLMPNVVNEPPRRFKVGYPVDFPTGRVDTRFKEEYGVWLVHGDYGGRAQIFALRTVCTHLGCITIWQESEGQFKCPCHGSGFTMDGINFEGPAPRPLERYAIRVAEDGQLEIDRGRIFQEELGQWNDPASFVSV